MPKTIELKIHEPKDATDQWGPGVFAQRVAEAVAHREAELYIEYKGSFLGADACAKTDPFDKPKSGMPDSGPDCEVVCGDPDLLVQTLAELADFRIRYRAARDLMRRGKRAVFPYGTYALRLFYGVKVEEAPPDREWLAAAA